MVKNPKNPFAKTPDDVAEKACNLYVAGLPVTKIAEECKLHDKTVRNILKRKGVSRPQQQSGFVGSDVQEFASRARSVLWRRDGGKQRKTYERWVARCEWWGSVEGGGLSKKQATVQASKEFPQLVKIMKEYDFSEYEVTDPATVIQVDGFVEGTSDVVDEGKQLSHRDCMRWAANAAGHKGRTGQAPGSCPNNTCWYLYRMAIEEPKDFLAKMTQIESKIDKAEEDRQGTRREALMAAEDIHAQLETLEQEERENADQL
jgi:hypothetical protein